MCSNNIASEGLCAIARAMRSNGSLHSVYIWGNKLEEPACRVSIFVRWPSWRRHFGFRRCVLRICKWWLKKLTIDRFRKFRFVHLVLYVCFIWSYHYLSSNDMVLPSLFKKKNTTQSVCCLWQRANARNPSFALVTVEIWSLYINLFNTKF